MRCPCGGSDFATCCGPFLSGQKLPETAEKLMRSRYTAFTMANVDYILNTHHPKTVSSVDRENTESWAKDSVWKGLEIIQTRAGGPDNSTGVVEFVARFTHQEEDQVHHEVSDFVKVDGQWFYMDGKIPKGQPVKRDQPKVGRNDPCPCGSGKKFKKCCAAA